MTYKDFLEKYNPKNRQLFDQCLPEEQKRLEAHFKAMLARKLTERPEGSPALRQMVDSIDYAFGKIPHQRQLYSWESVNEEEIQGLRVLIGTRSCGRQFYSVIGESTESASRFLDGFLYAEVCDRCGIRIFPGTEESLIGKDGRRLYYHPSCPVPKFMLQRLK